MQAAVRDYPGVTGVGLRTARMQIGEAVHDQVPGAWASDHRAAAFTPGDPRVIGEVAEFDEVAVLHAVDDPDVLVLVREILRGSEKACETAFRFTDSGIIVDNEDGAGLAWQR